MTLSKLTTQAFEFVVYLATLLFIAQDCGTPAGCRFLSTREKARDRRRCDLRGNSCEFGEFGDCPIGLQARRPPTQSNPGNDNKRNWRDSRMRAANGDSRHGSSFSECGSYCHRGGIGGTVAAADPLDWRIPGFFVRLCDCTIVVCAQNHRERQFFDAGGGGLHPE